MLRAHRGLLQSRHKRKEKMIGIPRYRIRCCGAIIALFTIELVAATLTRGPYLQSGTTNSVVVRWRTDEPTESHVKFGDLPSNLNRTIFTTSATTNHEVIVAGLLPNAQYYYSIGTESNTLAGGAEYFFVTSPETRKPTRIWVLGDAGTRNSSQRAVRDAYYAYSTNRHTDLWLMLGDNAYGVGTDDQYQGAVFNMYSEMLRKSVLWPTLGNHDTYSTGVVEQFPYLEIFTLPIAGEAGGVPSATEKYYSFNYGHIHFVVLDSMSSDRRTNSPMCSWLAEDLATSTNEWTIAFWHHPPYTKGSHDSDDEHELIQMRQFVVPILEAHGVDLILCGHSHSYERSYLLQGHYGRSSTLVPEMIRDRGGGRETETGPYRVDRSEGDGTVYVVAGSSGQISGGDLNHPAMYVSLNKLGSLVLDIDGGRLDAAFLQSNGNLGDTFTMLKPGTPQAIRITSFIVNSQIMDIAWSANTGQTYHVERARSLAAPEWERISPPIIAVGDTAIWTYPIDPNPRCYYRVTAF